MIELEKLEEIYREWVLPSISKSKGEHYSIDGKACRGAGKFDECSLHTISGYMQESSHRRVVSWRIVVTKCIEDFEFARKWKDIKATIMVERKCKYKGKTTINRRYFISSLSVNASAFRKLICEHRGIENSLHWALDVAFGDDGEIVRQARLNAAASPNIMPKIPVIPEGLRAIETLAGEGIPLCCTEVMGVRQATDAAEAYMRGSAKLERPAPCVIAHIAGIYNEYLADFVCERGIDIQSDILWHTSVALAKKVYEFMTERRYPVEFLSGGARALHHFTEFVGVNGAVRAMTIPLSTCS